MSSIAVAGDTSGVVTISAPAVAGTPTLTLPTTSGTVVATSGGYVPTSQLASGSATSSTYLRGDQTWATISSGATTLKIVTDSTDIALTASPPTYYSIGSSFSVSIPTTGIIRVVSFVGRIDNYTLSQGGGPTFGIRIGSTNYWFALVSDNGTDKYYMGIAELGVVGYMATNGSLLNNANATYIKSQCLDIAYNSVPTGTQTVQLICSKTNSTYTDNITLKGTTRTTKVGIEFVSAS